MLKSLKEKVTNNKAFYGTVNDLITAYREIENSDKFNNIAAISLTLLLYISGDFNEAMKLKTKVKTLKVITSNDEISQLFSIGKRHLKDPYPDVYNYISYFLTKINSTEVNTLAQILLQTYERDQAVFLSKFFSKIKVATLKKYIGGQVKDDKIGEYLNKYGWELKGDFIVTAKVQEKFDTFQMREDLDFINKMTVNFENIAKANTTIKPSES